MTGEPPASKHDRIRAAWRLYVETETNARKLFVVTRAPAKKLYDETEAAALKLYDETVAQIEAEERE